MATGLLLPKFLIGLFFGKANRSSGSYEELVKKYISKLENVGKAKGRFIPKETNPGDKQKNIHKLLILVAVLIKNVNGFSENQLDKYILPHPLLVKATLREMMYFTIYHAGHHQKQVMRNLGRLTTVSKTE